MNYSWNYYVSRNAPTLLLSKILKLGRRNHFQMIFTTLWWAFHQKSKLGFLIKWKISLDIRAEKAIQTIRAHLSLLRVFQCNPNGMSQLNPINSTNCRQVPERIKLSTLNYSSPGTLFTNTGLLLGNVLVPGVPLLTLLPTELVAVALGAFSKWSASLSDGAW